MKKKLNMVILLLIIGTIGLMTTRLFITLFPQKDKSADTSEGVSYIEEVKNPIKPTEAKTEKKKTKRETTTKPETTTESAPPALEDGNFKAAFRDFIITGDSIVEAINEYGVLDDTQVIGGIGAGTRFLNQSADEIISNKPKYLILHYGENELSTEADAPYFINRYKEAILSLKEQLPDTVIFVDSIFPVLEKAYSSEPYTVNIDYYNSLIKEMCSEIGVVYLDFTPQWNSYEKNYYDADGIHPLKSFYTEQYLPYIYAEAMKSN